MRSCGPVGDQGEKHVSPIINGPSVVRFAVCDRWQFPRTGHTRRKFFGCKDCMGACGSRARRRHGTGRRGSVGQRSALYRDDGRRRPPIARQRKDVGHREQRPRESGHQRAGRGRCGAAVALCRHGRRRCVQVGRRRRILAPHGRWDSRIDRSPARGRPRPPWRRVRRDVGRLDEKDRRWRQYLAGGVHRYERHLRHRDRPHPLRRRLFRNGRRRRVQEQQCRRVMDRDVDSHTACDLDRRGRSGG